MEKNRLTLSQISLVVMILAAAAFMLLPRQARYSVGEKYASTFEFFQPFERKHRAACQTHLKNAGLALAQYTADYNVYPPVRNAASSAGWADMLQPYLKGYRAFSCPNTPFFPKLIFKQSTRFPTRYTALWLNVQMGKLRPQSIASPTRKLLLGEGDYTTDTGYSKSQIPPEWLTDRRSPSYRHLGGANYLMADGHTKWLRPSQIREMEASDSIFAPH